MFTLSIFLKWFLQQRNPVATYMGSVGNDFQKTQLQKLAKAAGITAIYQIHETKCTGYCGVLIHKENRLETFLLRRCFSLVTLFQKENNGY